ncbi:MAG: PBSX family phage terminase large subunit [Clostridia bacterium]|nr:PBSX family phage terminase large subunit [Clostridia bacterium]
MNTDVYINDSYMQLINDPTFLKIVFGGSSSGKSYFMIGQNTVLDNMQNGANYLIVRKTANTLRKSVFNEINKGIINLGVRHLYDISKTDLTITNKQNGKQILFGGLDDVEKIKSITPQNGVLEKIIIEEATETTYTDYKALTKRLRGYSKVPKGITLLFNPILRTHWIYEEFFADCWNDEKRFYKDERKLILKTTYKDNKFLTPDDIYLLENEKDPYFYNVYTLGNFGILGNVVYRNYRVEDLSAVKNSFDNIYQGLDFGWNNPNAYVKMHVNESKKQIFVLDELYKSSQTYDSLANDLSLKNGLGYITADCEDGRAINELRSRGLRVIPAKKGSDSVLSGIRFIQDYEIIIDPSCQNFINEIQVYHWAEDKDGNAIEKPVKKKDHLMDAMRYGLEPLMLQTKATAGRRL